MSTLAVSRAFAGLEGVYPEDLGLSPIKEGAKGEIITINCSVFDGTGWPLRDAMLESWQPDAAGKFAGQNRADPHVSAFCRFAADKDTGEFILRTVEPGKTPVRVGGFQVPHISIWFVARGINIGLSIRVYIEDEDNSSDLIFAGIEQTTRADRQLVT